MALNQQQKQRATGYMFAILAIGIAGASIIGFAGGDRADIVLAFPVVAFLSYLSWKQLQPTSTGTIPTADERTGQIVRNAGNQTFWMLVIIMLAQQAFGFIPDNLLTSGYLLIAMLIFGIYWAYYRWRGLPI